MADTQFKQVPFHAVDLLPCGLCSSDVAMWQITENDTAQFFVACTLGDHVSPLGDDCPLYHPPRSFYAARRVEAAKYWNEWMKFGASQRQARAAKETPPAPEEEDRWANCDHMTTVPRGLRDREGCDD